MRLLLKVFALAALISCAFASRSLAGSLQVAPVLLEVLAPSGATAVVVKNPASEPVSAQVRVYRWEQSGGEETLTETREVVASPPLFKVGAQSQQIVRLVRTAKTPILDENSYRILIDELPSSTGAQGHSVQFAMRYSIPLFFQPSGLLPPKLEWTVVRSGKKLHVSARNMGDRHARISGLQLQDARGHRVSLSAGLTGYVLGRAQMSWTFASALPAVLPNEKIEVLASTDQGPVKATTTLRDTR